MSSEQSSINAETIEQTKQQIRGLVAEIARLSKSDLAPEEYYPAFLQRIISALAAIGGAVWLVREGNRLQLGYQINISEALLDPTSSEAARHVRLLERAAQSGQPQLVPPLSGAAEEDAPGNPTRYLLVLAPLAADGQLEALVEIFQRPEAPPATQRGYVRFLVQMCELAAEWVKTRKLRQFSDRHSLWAQADQFARMAHESLDVRETAYTIANEGRRLIGCDRVSVAVKRGRVCRVEAVSGQDTIEPRSNIIAALNRLATCVCATGEPLWYDGSTEDLPPQIEKAIDEYVDQSYAKSLVVLPLRKPATLEEVTREVRPGEPSPDRQEDRPVIGALIVEQIETELPRELLEPRVDLVYEHSTRALANALEYHSVFLMPLWRAIGRSRVLVAARNLPKTITVSAILLILLVVLFVVPKDFNLECRGKLQPKMRRDVFFAAAGEVQEIHVRDGDKVRQGDKLVTLVNHDLEQEWARLQGELQETEKRISAIAQQRLQRFLTPAQAEQLTAEQAQLELRAGSLRRQLALLEEKRKQLVVLSPVDGVVMLPWDAEQSLLHRPVAPGQKVLTIADPEGEWELELAMPERKMGHVNRAQRELGEDLQVSYILATDPGRRRYGTLRRVGRTVQISETDRSPVVKLIADIDERDLYDPQTGARPRPGASVIADVNCGRVSVGYAIFHEVISWVQAHILF